VETSITICYDTHTHTHTYDFQKENGIAIVEKETNKLKYGTLLWSNIYIRTDNNRRCKWKSRPWYRTDTNVNVNRGN
jgi:hypothetical protein